jgi:hypothetical protein
MTAIHSKYLQIFNAKQFKESVSEPSSSNVYLTFGRTEPWPNDAAPIQAKSSVSAWYDIWKSMIGGKRVVGNDIRHVVPRHDWTANTVYNAYDNDWDSLILKDANNQFYVITDEFNVYKCLGNNWAGGANVTYSTEKPRSTNPYGNFQTSDKYIWKYLYTLNSEEQIRFTTEDFFPVKTLVTDDNTLQWQVQDTAIPGAIHYIAVTSMGSGYTSNNITIRITGDGQYANAYAVRNTFTDKITSIVVDNKGAGYTWANVSVISSRGNGASMRAYIAPPGGHGSDALTELGGAYLMINTTVNDTEGDVLDIENDFRQVCLIEDPLLYGTENTSSNLVFSQLTTLTMSESSITTNYVKDEVVYQGNSLANASFKGIVVSWDLANVSLKLSNVEGTPSAQLLIGTVSTTSRYLSSIKEPDLERYSGNLLYTNNITPIERSSDQSEDYKIILSF